MRVLLAAVLLLAAAFACPALADEWTAADSVREAGFARATAEELLRLALATYPPEGES